MKPFFSVPYPKENVTWEGIEVVLGDFCPDGDSKTAMQTTITSILEQDLRVREKIRIIFSTFTQSKKEGRWQYDAATHCEIALLALLLFGD